MLDTQHGWHLKWCEIAHQVTKSENNLSCYWRKVTKLEVSLTDAGLSKTIRGYMGSWRPVLQNPLGTHGHVRPLEMTIKNKCKNKSSTNRYESQLFMTQGCWSKQNYSVTYHQHKWVSLVVLTEGFSQWFTGCLAGGFPGVWKSPETRVFYPPIHAISLLAELGSVQDRRLSSIVIFRIEAFKFDIA